MLERAQQKALIEEKERATAEALKNMGQSQLVMIGVEEAPAELGLPTGPTGPTASTTTTTTTTTTPAASTTPAPTPAATTPAPTTPAPSAPAAQASPAPTTPAASSTPTPTTPAATTSPAPTTPAATASPAPTTPSASASPAPTTPAAEASPAPVTPEVASPQPSEAAPGTNAKTEDTLSAANPAATSSKVEDTAATTSNTLALDGKNTEPTPAVPGATVTSSSSSGSSTTTTSTHSSSSSSGSTSAPVSEAKLSKADENEIKIYSKLGATLPVKTDVTVPSFRTSHLKDDAATKQPATPCALRKPVTSELDTSNEGDMLPYPNKIVTEKQ